ncbi:MAG: 3-phosphoshikimate 1-carboxyvinyltransferase [Deltaproteobacteria bacterium]|nr:3-phosphoshikimate 1-carboxyvinyltransferase [Deltaproteobacteria bacterium]MBI3390646.1 3-phosphoshikimate 1-carboxyvinyltransferase [Deltaproteobacteria bacterium]
MTDAIAIRPLTQPPDAVVAVPGSRSVTNRALLIAALGEGRSTLDGASFSDDTDAMAAAWRTLGVPVAEDAAALRFVVDGCSGQWPVVNAVLDARAAGTAMRFLTAALCVGRGHYRLDGTARMRERPIQDLLDALSQLGARVRSEHDTGCPPVVIDARGLPGGTATVAGDKSSQFLSALLMAAPYAQRDVTIAVRGQLIARPFVDMTLGVMADFGVAVERDADLRFRIRSGQRYRGRTYRIEPDALGAHYFFAAAAVTGGRVRVNGIGRHSTQGDARFVEVLATMGATVTRTDEFIEVIGPTQLHGVDVDLNEISDTALTLAAIAPFASTPVRIRNVAHIRLQESDRLHAAATELQRLGVAVSEHDDGLEIQPSPVQPATVQTYDDHRVAMSFALIGLRVPGIRIADPACVAKTFPDYFARLESLRR